MLYKRIFQKFNLKKTFDDILILIKFRLQTAFSLPKRKSQRWITQFSLSGLKRNFRQ